MNPKERRVKALESKRIALNQQLMSAQTLVEANEIERELWALRLAISRYGVVPSESTAESSETSGQN